MRCHTNGKDLCRYAELSYDFEDIEGCRIEKYPCMRLRAEYETAAQKYDIAHQEWDAFFKRYGSDHHGKRKDEWSRLSLALHEAEAQFNAIQSDWLDELDRVDKANEVPIPPPSDLMVDIIIADRQDPRSPIHIREEDDRDSRPLI